MSHRRKELEQKIARRKRNVYLGIGVLFILFGVDGIVGAIGDFRRGDLTSGTAALSQQPYGPFLRLFCFSFMVIMAFWFIREGIRTRPGATSLRDDERKF
jgi:hypothetical protein